MDVFLQIAKQLPPFWPRLLVLLILLGLVALPQARRLATRGGTGARRLERAKALLEVRKLEIEVAALRAAHPGIPDSKLDAALERLLGASAPPEEPDEAPLPWRERIRLAGLGAAAFLALGIAALAVSGRAEGLALGSAAAKELLLLVPCALVASAIPTRERWGPVFYAFLVPLLVVVLAVTARLAG